MRLIDGDALLHETFSVPINDAGHSQEWKDGVCQGVKDALRAVANIVRNAPTVAQTGNEWISVKERLPEMRQTVVCAVYGTDLVEQEDGETFVDALRRNRKHPHIELGYLEEDGWNGWEGFPMIVSPSYWMPFPDIEMPEVEDEKS